jgi:hypothetical protein
MVSHTGKFIAKFILTTAAILLLSPLGALAQSTANQSSSATENSTAARDRWLHVRVISSDDRGETVRVNIPLELAEKVLPAVNHDRLHDGKVRIDQGHMNDVDLRAIVDAIRTTKDGEFVTVQKDDCDVRVAKQNNYLIVHVVEKCLRGKCENEKGQQAKANALKTQVEIKVPMKVVDALFSAGKDELDIVAALRALSAQSDQELVSVKDHENTVRVWLDSKNVTD